MASTILPVTAFDFAKTMVKGMRLDDVKLRVLDDVNKYMWMAAPWRWTLGSLPAPSPAVLTANTQDYAITLPGDFLYLEDVYISDGTTAPRSLRIVASLPATTKYVGQPSQVAISGAALRITPVPGSVINNNGNIVGLYKKIAPVFTMANISTAGTQVFDDEWFWVFQEGVLWKAYLYADDERAGNVTVSDGKVQYTGQRAVFEAGLQYMRQIEKLPEPRKERPE